MKYPQFLLTNEKVVYDPNGKVHTNIHIKREPIAFRHTNAIVIRKEKDNKKSFTSGGKSYSWYDVTFQRINDDILTKVKALNSLPDDVKRIILKKTKNQNEIPKIFTINIFISKSGEYKINPFLRGDYSSKEYVEVTPLKLKREYSSIKK